MVSGIGKIGLSEQPTDMDEVEMEVKAAVKAANAAVRRESAFVHDFEDEEESPVVKLFNSLLMRGYKTNASDIHIEPAEEELVIRMRIDGMLTEYVRMEKKVHLPLISCAKIKSGMDIAEKRLPQDGHCKVVIQGKEMNLRASTVPTVYGEKMVLRFLNMDVIVDRAETFGMDPENYRKLVEILKRPSGIVYFTGPTGSGKSTTLYMILEQMAKRPINIMTIEDPVEKTVAGVNQIQVNGQAGLTFETGLRAILRQDPDVIMVGETRDNQTAKISVRAAVTGHLILSTLHTNEAVGAISRMIDMGVEPFMAAESLSGVVAQRLVRKVCSHCRKAEPVSEEEAKILGPHVKMVYRGEGCNFCNHTGYRGRIAVHEVLVIDKTIRKMIIDGKNTDDIFAYARGAQGICTLKDGLIRLVEQGVITVEELLRMTYGE